MLLSLPVLKDLGLGFILSVSAGTRHAGWFQGREVPQAHFEDKACTREQLLFRPPFRLSVTQLIPLAA